LKENFEVYGIDKLVGKSVIADALARECQAYSDAARVVCRSRNAATTVVENYGVDAEKVHIVPGGANILRDLEAARHGFTDLPLTPVRLGFIGKDWRRKNLAFVLEIADVLNSRGIMAEVLAAGFNPAKGPLHARLKSVGFIDKSADESAFVNFLRACHFTCLFSSAEAFGLSNRESLRCGVPVMARNIGGIPDAVPKGCGHLFEPDAEAADVADVIAGYVREPIRYWTLRDAIAERSEEFSWAAAVKKMKAIWSGSTAHAYQKNISNGA
jgi:glycosyltransferase involved in cell wall biosynthesis